MNKKFLRLLTAGAALSLWSAMASSAIVNVDISGTASWDELDDPDNVVLTIEVGPPGSVVTGIGWDVRILPEGDSWYSDATVLITDSAGGQGIILTPGVGDDFGGSTPMLYNSGGILDLTSAGVDNIVLADGFLVLQFFEAFDDVADAIDATWIGGSSLQFEVVPIPGAVWLLGSGLLGLAGLRRRTA